MLIRAGFSIRFEAETPTPMLALLNLHPSRHHDLRSPHRIVASPDIPMFDYTDTFGNVVSRFTVPAGGLDLACDFVVEDTGAPDPLVSDAIQHPVEDLPEDVIVFVLGSRYCETDRFLDLAWALFGQTEPGWLRVQAIVDYAHDRIEFGYHHARATKTAWEAHEERAGVCRDFAHLAITLCRAMNIPARYCTGYLGDIGIAPIDAPMDFSAWFEVFLGGRWHVFDARHNTPRIGRILMARGRDATDAALTTAFGRAVLVRFEVHTDEIDG